MLNASIKIEELTEAVVAMANSKSRGTDRLPVEVYKRYSEPLLPVLLATLNDAVGRGTLPSSMSEVIIVVLPKPGKDPLLLDSYRPISLINTVIKLLARVVNGLIHLDKLVFIPARSMALNI